MRPSGCRVTGGVGSDQILFRANPNGRAGRILRIVQADRFRLPIKIRNIIRP
jgi:hypothetical protein